MGWDGLPLAPLVSAGEATGYCLVPWWYHCQPDTFCRYGFASFGLPLFAGGIVPGPVAGFFYIVRSQPTEKKLLRWQICWDLLFATSLIFLAGGIVSHLSFLYIFIIFSVSIFLSRREVFVSASAAAILYGGLLDLQYYSALPVVSAFPANPASSREIFYDIFINVIVFYLIAFLSSLLSERLRRSELALKKRQIDFEELENLNKIILEIIPSGLIIINNVGRIRSFNAGAATITGYALESIYNRPIAELFPDMNVLEGENFKPLRAVKRA